MTQPDVSDELAAAAIDALPDRPLGRRQAVHQQISREGQVLGQERDRTCPQLEPARVEDAGVGPFLIDEGADCLEGHVGREQQEGDADEPLGPLLDPLDGRRPHVSRELLVAKHRQPCIREHSIGTRVGSDVRFQNPNLLSVSVGTSRGT